MLSSLRSGKSLAALFGDVFGNIKGSFLTTTENLIQQSQTVKPTLPGVADAGEEGEGGYVRFDESMADADDAPPGIAGATTGAAVTTTVVAAAAAAAVAATATAAATVHTGAPVGATGAGAGGGAVAPAVVAAGGGHAE